jgi:hypothetical protein
MFNVLGATVIGSFGGSPNYIRHRTTSHFTADILEAREIFK